MTASLTDTARGVLVAEGMHPANVDFRVRLLSPRRLLRMEVLHAFDREHGQVTPTAPYVHSSPSELLRPGAGENLEWFTFAATLAADAIRTGDDSSILSSWQALAATDGIRTRTGTHTALRNLRKGLLPPQSGHDNPHYFDDLAMIRAAAIAAVAPDDSTALRLTDLDAHVTHDLDGVFAARATNVLIRALLAGETASAAVEAAVDAVPEGTWTRRLVDTALTVTAGTAGNPYERAARLSSDVSDWLYSYTVVAPNTLATLLAHTASANTATELLLGSSIGERNGTTVAALTGAIAAIRFGTDWMPAALTPAAATLPGISVPTLTAGTLATHLPERAA